MKLNELKKEHERLSAIIKEAKEAGPKLKQIEVLMAMYGDEDDQPNGGVPCEYCERHIKPMGMTLHLRKAHGVKKPAPRKATARKATARRKVA